MIRPLVGVVFYVGLFAFFLFTPARTLDWPRAWILLGVLFVVRVFETVSVFRVNRELLEERAKPPLQKGQPLLDKVLVLSFMASFAGLVAVASFDRFRWRVLPAPPPVLSAFGLLLFIAGWRLVALVFLTNAFAAVVVRHQAERKHEVVSTGPYRIVRHPMYAGILLGQLGLALWLESWLAAACIAVPLALLAARITLEERLLARELPGYAEYAGRVRWRLVPGVW